MPERPISVRWPPISNEANVLPLLMIASVHSRKCPFARGRVCATFLASP